MNNTDKTVENTSQRKQVEAEFCNVAIKRLQKMLAFRLNQKGCGTLASRHEILGIIQEEFAELTEAVQKGDLAAVQDELLDIEVACCFGDACIEAGTVDW